MLLVDSTVFIHFLRGNRQAKDFLLQPPAELGTSVIVVMEIIDGLRSKDKIADFLLFLQLSQIEIIHLSTEISMTALELFKHYCYQGLGKADSLIAATALERNSRLATHNSRHFSLIKHLKVIKPY